MHSPPLPDDDVLSQLPPARYYKRRRQRRLLSPQFQLQSIPWRDLAFTGLGAVVAIASLALIYRALL